LESLSSYARQFLNIHEKPEFGEIKGLAPTIAINQKTTSNNPRSTVGTITEIYDYMRLLFARIGRLYSPASGEEIKKQTTSQIIQAINEIPFKTKVNLMAPLIIHQKGEHQKIFEKIKKSGFQRIRIDGIIYDIDEIPEIEKNKYHDIEAVVDRFEINPEDSERIASSVETASRLSDGIVYVEILDKKEKSEINSLYKIGEIIKFSEKFVCIESGFSLPEIEPRSFSFNNTNSACEKCEGIGSVFMIDPDLILSNKSSTIMESLKALIPNHYLLEEISDKIKIFLEKTPFFIESPWSDLDEEIKDFIFYGKSALNKNLINKKDYFKEILSKQIAFNGLIDFLEKASSYYGMNSIKNFQSEIKCPSCKGFRLGKDILNVKINGLHIGEVSELTVSDSLAWFENLPSHLRSEEKKISEKIIKEIILRLKFLIDVGLDYLLISRKAGSLSGGENQRIRLASQIGSALSGVIYVLDEPSIGLHQSDNDKLIQTLKKLKNLGNSVIVVEHDEDTMRSADYLIDMGPGAGKFGGKVISFGTPEEVSKDENSLTGRYLSGKEKIEVPSKRRDFDHQRKIILSGASENNLKNITAEFPLGLMTCVTGVSGSGKSTLVFDTLQEILRRKFGLVNSKPGKYSKISGLDQIDKFIEIDQSPIGRTPRSNPATYTGTFDLIRSLFASLPESKARGYLVGRFSFNVEGGRCEACTGDGYKKIEMHFLPDVFIPCEVCKSQRYNKETLEILYKGKNIADILAMNIQDCLEFFEKKSGIKEKLQTLVDVGLGYLTLGQSVTTISGGESQRIKLAKELSKRSTGKTLYFLDEPTTGLHSHDIKNLLNVLERLLKNGNTIIVIEHNLDVIKCSDYIIDIGPGGGKRGGEIVCCGTPEDIAKNEKSLTGLYLKKYLNS
jgi:excinuclease ABC subunit A